MAGAENAVKSTRGSFIILSRRFLALGLAERPFHFAGAGGFSFPAMSIKIMTEVWETSPARGTELFLLIALADFANDQGECWPGVETLARKIRATRRSVQRLLRNLEEAGLVTCLEGGGRESNRYLVHTRDKITPPPATPEPPQQRKIVAAPATPVSPDPLGTPKEAKKGAKPLPDIPLPLLLRTPEFSSAWTDWNAYRREIKKPLVASSATAQLEKLLTFGVADAIESIRNSIQNQWQGLFPPKTNGNARNQRPNPRDCESTRLALADYEAYDKRMAAGGV